MLQVASTTWKIALGRMNGMPDDHVGHFVHGHGLYSYLQPWNTFGLYERQQMWKSAFKFLFVRHPFDRLVSAYYNKIVDMKPPTGSQKNA